MGAWLPYRCARRFLSEFFPIDDDPPWHETIRRRTTRVGVGLERETLSRAKSPRPAPPSETMTVSIDAGHVRTARGHQGRTFEVMAAQVSNDDGRPVLFSGVPGEADHQDIGRSEPERDEHPTIPGPAKCTNAHRMYFRHVRWDWSAGR
jgi:hypothetical protein